MNQQPVFSMQQSFGMYNQNPSIQLARDFYTDLKSFQGYLDRTKDDGNKEIKQIGDQQELTKKLLKEQCFKQAGVTQSQRISQNQQGELIDWVDGSMKIVITDNLQKAEQKNKDIFKLLLEVHQLMEQYSTEKGKLSKNSAKELQLINEIQNMNETLYAQQQKLQEIQQKLEYTDLDPQTTKLRKNPRVQEFDQQSFEIMNKLRVDYTANRICLDKSKWQIDEMRATLENKNK